MSRDIERVLEWELGSVQWTSKRRTVDDGRFWRRWSELAAGQAGTHVLIENASKKEKRKASLSRDRQKLRAVRTGIEYCCTKETESTSWEKSTAVHGIYCLCWKLRYVSWVELKSRLADDGLENGFEWKSGEYRSQGSNRLRNSLEIWAAQNMSAREVPHVQCLRWVEASKLREHSSRGCVPISASNRLPSSERESIVRIDVESER